MRLALTLSILACSLLVSCATPGAGNQGGKKELTQVNKARYKAFRDRPDYRATLDIYVEEVLLNRSPLNARIEVDLSDQRVRLFKGGSVALDTPCSTGRAGKTTPAGQFVIKEKLVDKRSNIFGKVIRNGKVIASGDCRGKKGAGTFVGASLPYWMRLTDDGIGLHASPTIARYPRSNGCVRLPKTAVATIFENVAEGTPVAVVR